MNETSRDSFTQVRQEESLSPYLSPFPDHCQGARDPNRYFIAMNVSAAKVPKTHGHAGSDGLDRINAFDLAEVAQMNFGQSNVIEVSSFCGKEGLIWGYDMAPARDLQKMEPMFSVTQWDGRGIPVFGGEPLVRAAQSLFGTVARSRFPLAPGTHCPTAAKYVTRTEPGMIYAVCGIGIRDKEGLGASILMEDTGMIDAVSAARPGETRKGIEQAVAGCIMSVARNQRIKCEKIFVSYISLEVEEGEVGCCLTAVPYFSLAGAAVPAGGLESLRSVTLEDWEAAVTSKAH